MPILTILIVIFIAGVLLWLCNRFLPMEGAVKQIFNIVCVLLLIVFLLKAFGLWDWLMSARV